LPKHFLPFPGEAGVADDQVHHFDQDARSPIVLPENAQLWLL
jgi:hypothetical protein